MEEEQRRKLETLVKHHATGEARGYYLKHAMNGRYPNAGFFLLDPFEGPENIPGGDYQVFYTRLMSTDAPVLPAGGPNPLISIAPTAGAANKPATKEQVAQTQVKADPKNAWMDDPRYVKQRLELEAERFAHEMQENKLLVGRRVRLSSENAEYIVLLRAMRHELTQAFQMATEGQRASLQLIGDLQARLAEADNNKGAPPQPQSTSWLTPEMLMLGTSLLKSLLGKGDDDAVNATILDKKTKELKKQRDKAKRKLSDLDKGKPKKEEKPKKAAVKGASRKPKQAKAAKGQLTKGDKR